MENFNIVRRHTWQEYYSFLAQVSPQILPYSEVVLFVGLRFWGFFLRHQNKVKKKKSTSHREASDICNSQNTS